MAESTILEVIDTDKVERQSRYFKAKVLEDHQADGTNQIFKNAIADKEVIVFTDQSTSYVNIADYVDIRVSEKSSDNNNKRNP